MLYLKLCLWPNLFTVRKIIYNLIDYLIHIRDTNLKVKVLSALKHFTTNKHTGFDYSISYKVGDVCWIEFGDNLTPEMALNHMGIIFSKEITYEPI